MAWQPKTKKVSLDDRFRLAEDAFPGAAGAWDSHLRFGVGVEDGERYLLRLFKKSGTPLDEDLSRLIARGLRRIRRVLSSRRSRDLLVEVREVAEDHNELAIVMLDPGSPVGGSSRTIRTIQDFIRTGIARKTFWRNIARVAEALAICHDAGIVHGAISEHAIFSHGDGREDYRLGGYEACVHIADGDLGGAGHPLRPSGAISFRQDWMDLGRTASTFLGATNGAGPSLLAVERRMLALLWQILRAKGFPNRWIGDSWLIGVWRADQWKRTGKRISIAGWRRLWLRYGTRRGHGCVRPTSPG